MNSDKNDIEYLNTNKNTLFGRAIMLFPFFDGKEWKVPLNADNRVIMLTGIPQDSVYISKSVVNLEIDMYIPIIDFLYKHASWKDIIYHIHGLENDIINLFVSISKIDNFLTIKNRSFLSDYIRTELEYIYIVCKSLFDILQIIICRIWKKYRKVNEKHITQLPETFRKMVYDGKLKLWRNSNQIVERFKIPNKLANFYTKNIVFYEKLAKIRDDVVHNEKSFDLFYVFEDGFSISEREMLFKEYNIWNHNDKKPNDLYSIRPLINHLITTSINACNQFYDCISTIIPLPESIYPNYNLYLRTVHVKSFSKMQIELNKTSWWSR